MSSNPAPAPTESATRLIYPLPRVPSPGEALPVADGVYWLRMPLPFALDHINLWLLADGAGWTLVDCGYTSDATRELWEQVVERHLEGRPVTRVIATHFHPDHVGMAWWLTRRFAAPLWMTRAEFLTAHLVREGTAGYGREPLLALFRRHGLDEMRLSALGERPGNYRRGVPELPLAYQPIAEAEILSIGGRPWRVIVGRGHAPEHACLYCEPLGLLISGDMVLPKISTNVSVWPNEPDADPLSLFLSSLERLRELLSDTLILPSHGSVFQGLALRIAELKSHHRRRLAELAAACRRPRTAAELLPVLFPRELDNHQLFFAIGEAIAHLNFLWHRGGLARTQDDKGIYRFASTALAANLTEG